MPPTAREPTELYSATESRQSIGIWGSAAPPRLYYQAKANGGFREIHLFPEREKAIHREVARRLAAIADPTFSMRSFAYRPGRTIAGAAHFLTDRLDGETHLLKADLADCFGSTPHEAVFRRLRELAVPAADEQFVRRILQPWGRGEHPRGLAQGSPLAPLLSNLVLDRLDRDLETHGIPFVRYADDLVVPVGGTRQGRDVLAMIGQAASRQGFRLALEKCGTQPLACAGWLGFDFRRDQAGRWRPVIAESHIQDLTEHLRRICRTTPKDSALARCDRLWREWRGHHAGCGDQDGLHRAHDLACRAIEGEIGPRQGTLPALLPARKFQGPFPRKRMLAYDGRIRRSF